jgi:hypothetical protein
LTTAVYLLDKGGAESSWSYFPINHFEKAW